MKERSGLVTERSGFVKEETGLVEERTGVVNDKNLTGPSNISRVHTYKI